MAKETRIKTIKIAFLAVLTSGVFVLLLHLFYAQLIDWGDRWAYFSDIKLHLEFALEGKGYSILYRVLALIYNFLGGKMGVAVFECIVVLATWFLSSKLVCVMYKNWKFFEAVLVMLPVTFISAIYIPVIYPHFYSGQLVTQPYHNITFYGMRLLSVAAMLIFFRMFENYLEKIKFIDWILVSAILACSTSVKPSFFYGFALTLLIFLIIDFIKTRFKAKPFLKMVILGLIVIPSLLIMAFQATKLYGKPVESGGSGIAIVWGESLFTNGIYPLIKIFCGVGFPCLVAIANFKNLKRFEKFTYVMFIVQFIISVMFVESGRRAAHGNFAWGIYGAGFFLFIVTFVRFIDNLKDHKNKNKIYLIVGGILMLAHLISSACYFYLIVLGNIYKI